MILELPERGRPTGVYYKKCDLGVDLPSSFVHKLKSIDKDLYPVFHRYRTLWDSIINADSGKLEDPRYEINYKYGELNFGFVLTDGKGRPTPDGTWHVWRWCEPHGWAHVINMDSKDPQYLNLLAHRLHLQAKYNDKYGHSGYSRMLEELDIQQRSKEQEDREDLMNEIGKVNSGMMSRIADNYARGQTAPTNPTMEKIISYPGQGNRTKTVRPLDDAEGGLILPPGWD